MHFLAVKKLKKRSGFVINSNLKDSAFKEVKRDAKYVNGVPYEKGPFPV